MIDFEKIFYNIKKNKPIFIKNWIGIKKRDDTSFNNFYDDSIEQIIKNATESNIKNSFLKGAVYLKNNFDNKFINDILVQIKKNKHVVVDEEIRVWIHQKDNITRWHYDGNGIDIINICLSGKKLFILSEPESQITIPFSNITLFETHKKEYEYILEKGDLLLIPRFWNHKIITLQNNTTTINFTLTNNYNNIPKNKRMLYNLHVFLNTRMSTEHICNFSNITISFYDFIAYFIKENIILFVLFLSIRFILAKLFDIKKILKNYLIYLLLFSTFIEKKYKYNSMGISTLIIFNTFLNNIIINNIML